MWVLGCLGAKKEESKKLILLFQSLIARVFGRGPIICRGDVIVALTVWVVSWSRQGDCQQINSEELSGYASDGKH